MQLRRAMLLPLVASLTVAACDSGTEPTVEFEVIEDVEFAESLDIDLAQMTRTSSGLYLQDLVVGTGQEAAVGDSARVEYVLWLRTGQELDAGLFPFRLGAGGAIQGFDQGVRGMRAGGLRRIVVPPLLAYGAQGSGRVPPGAVLVFQLHLLEISP